MSQSHPELVFIAGPQAGTRVILGGAVMVLGRAADADVPIAEQYVSRQHARYTLLADGPVVENLSAQGTWISGKKYKAGKNVLVETGDVIGLGRETEILFVGAGDDPDAALAALQAVRSKNAFGQAISAPQPVTPATVAAASEEPSDAQPGIARVIPRQEPAPAASKAQQAKSSRRKKLFIMLGIYLAALVMAGVFLSTLGGGDGQEMKIPREYTRTEIANALEQRPVRAVNPVLMDDRLKFAMERYQQYGLESPSLYRVLQAFKEAYAYSGRNFFANPEHDRIYKQVLDKVTQRVSDEYRNAYLFEKDNDWVRAEKEFGDLLAMLTSENEEASPLLTNIQDHYKRVKFFREKKTIKKKTAWS